MSNPIYDADRAIAAALQGMEWQQSGLYQAVGKTFNWCGGPGVIWFAALLWLGGRARKLPRGSLLGLRGAEAIAVASAVNGILKGLAGRVRPFVTPDEPWHWWLGRGWSDPHLQSFPSGHTIATVAFAAALSVAAVRFDSFQRFGIAVAAFASALLVAFARLYTNQHWFSDVFVSIVLGTTIGLMLTRWHERNPRTAFDRRLLGAGVE